MAVTKTCTRCGKDTTEKFEYCGFCGAPLEYIDPQRREPFAGFKFLSNMTGIVRLSKEKYRNIDNDTSLLIQSFFADIFVNRAIILLCFADFYICYSSLFIQKTCIYLYTKS